MDVRDVAVVTVKGCGSGAGAGNKSKKKTEQGSDGSAAAAVSRYPAREGSGTRRMRNNNIVQSRRAENYIESGELFHLLPEWKEIF